MPLHLQREIENLKSKLLTLGANVEEAVRQASLSVAEKKGDIAKQVIDNDIVIDLAEIEVEEDCLKILALYQPVAVDLRFIVAVLKINADLERIGDLAVNIAERSVFLAEKGNPDISFDFVHMSYLAQRMLKKALDALVSHSPSLAEEVCGEDDDIDAMNRQMFQQVEKGIQKNPEQTQVLLHMLSISRHLERIADHATNIAEDVIYMVEGKIVRHQAEEYE